MIRLLKDVGLQEKVTTHATPRHHAARQPPLITGSRKA
jgi:hypothetical protein